MRAESGCPRARPRCLLGGCGSSGWARRRCDDDLGDRIAGDLGVPHTMMSAHSQVRWAALKGASSANHSR